MFYYMKGSGGASRVMRQFPCSITRCIALHQTRVQYDTNAWFLLLLPLVVALLALAATATAAITTTISTTTAHLLPYYTCTTTLHHTTTAPYHYCTSTTMLRIYWYCTYTTHLLPGRSATASSQPATAQSGAEQEPDLL